MIEGIKFLLKCVSIPYRCNETAISLNSFFVFFIVSIPYRCNETTHIDADVPVQIPFQFLIGAMRRCSIASHKPYFYVSIPYRCNETVLRMP